MDLFLEQPSPLLKNSSHKIKTLRPSYNKKHPINLPQKKSLPKKEKKHRPLLRGKPSYIHFTFSSRGFTRRPVRGASSEYPR